MSAAPTQTPSHPLLERAYAIKNPDEAKALYDEWAATYDTDMVELDYSGPNLVVSAAKEHANIKGELLDAGCGTGIGGLQLSRLGATMIDGIDLSQGMLEVARKTQAYRDLITADLTKTLPIDDGKYDAVLCAGTLTYGHVGPEALDEFVRVTKVNGFVVATILDAVWESHGFRQKIDQLQEEQKIAIVLTEKKSYRKADDMHTRVAVLRRMSVA